MEAPAEPRTQESARTAQMRLPPLPAVALFTPPGAGADGWASRGRLAVVVPRSARALMGPSVFVYPGEMSRAAGAFDPALTPPQYVSLSGSRAPLHVPLTLHRGAC